MPMTAAFSFKAQRPKTKDSGVDSARKTIKGENQEEGKEF
jgi:hypothetical protein